MEAVATFSNHIKGYVLFKQLNNKSPIQIIGNLRGFKYYLSGGNNSQHGMHIHMSGDLRKGCESLCQHYNPHNNKHGGLDDLESHAGDLGNITVDNKGRAYFNISTNKISSLNQILGRSLIIHNDKDDLGKGTYEDSATTGHSGKRIACAIIGISENSCH